MSQARKQAITSFSLWLIIFIALVAVFVFSGTESITRQKPSMTMALMAIVILPGFIYNFVALKRTRSARLAGGMDERDEAIALKASEVTLVILTMLIYALAMGLFLAYRNAGAVPVGWLYFMAYGCISLIWLVHPGVSLVLDYGGHVDG